MFEGLTTQQAWLYSVISVCGSLASISILNKFLELLFEFSTRVIELDKKQMIPDDVDFEDLRDLYLYVKRNALIIHNTAKLDEYIAWFDEMDELFEVDESDDDNLKDIDDDDISLWGIEFLFMSDDDHIILDAVIFWGFVVVMLVSLLIWIFK